MKVSVIIPSYNRASYLSAAIESTLFQSVPPYEIIVVDDGSVDDTAEVCKNYGYQVRYVYQDNAGPSQARNNGIMHATGDLIAFLDSDDVWLPGKLERQVPLFKLDQTLGLCATAHYICDESGEITGSHSICPVKPERIRREIHVRNLFGTPTVIVRRDCFERVGLFDIRFNFGEDWDMWLRILSHFRGTFIPEPFCKCRRLATGITGMLHEQNFIDWLDIIRTNRARSAILYGRTIGYCRAMSWYYANLAYFYQQSQGSVHHGLTSVIMSIWYWPFFLWKRYYWLISPLLTLLKPAVARR